MQEQNPGRSAGSRRRTPLRRIMRGGSSVVDGARMGWQQADEEAVRRLIEWIARKIDPATRVLLREPGRSSVSDTLRFALVQSGQALPFDVTEGEWRQASSAVGRERLARRLGAALGLQPPDQLSTPARD